MSARTSELLLSVENERWARWIVLLASTVTGIAYGVLGDLAVGGVSVTLSRVFAALVLSPFAVTIGGPSVTLFPTAFLAGGLIFWPVYGLLAWRWLRTRRTWLAFALVCWCAQGFFQVIHRLEAIMSV